MILWFSDSILVYVDVDVVVVVAVYQLFLFFLCLRTHPIREQDILHRGIPQTHWQYAISLGTAGLARKAPGLYKLLLCFLCKH